MMPPGASVDHRTSPRHDGARARPTGFPAPVMAALLSHLRPSLVLSPPALLPRRTAAEVSAWFADDFHAPLCLDHRVLAAEVGRWTASHACRLLSSAPTRIPVSLVVREREGGRRYSFFVPDYRGPRLVSQRAYRTVTASSPRLLLSAIPRAVRAAFPAPPGTVYLLTDIERCFPVLLATVARDPELLGAARADLHQQAGDTMAPHLPPPNRRRVGKLFNNSVVGLISATGWYRELQAAGVASTAEEAGRMHAAWWARFASSRRFRDAWVQLHRGAAARNLPLRIVYPDGRSCSFDAATVRGRARRPRWAAIADPAHRLAAATRTTFSAIWRGVEGVVLDEAMHRLYPLRARGLRLVVPMYDGLLLQVPEGKAHDLARRVHREFQAALSAVGVPAAVKVTLQGTWGSRAKTPG